MLIHFEFVFVDVMCSVCFFVFFFFFKQKTAYEMRISDWSSDVCSSDLAGSRTAISSQSSAYPTACVGTHGSAWPTAGGRIDHSKIGRASCRERVCQYV